MKIRVGYGLGNLRPLQGDRLGALAEAIEHHGFDSLWLSERISGPAPDPMLGLTFAAARTKHIKLGTSVQVPTLGGSVSLKVPPGTHAGQQLRLAGRGLPKPRAGEGDLFAIVQIAVPTAASERERALLKELAETSKFNPRKHFEQGT